MKAYLSALVFLVACGSDGKSTIDSGGSGGPDSKVFMDAPPNVPATIMISGVATQRSANGSTMEANVLVQAFRNSDENTPIAMATTNAQGAYTLTITTNGLPLDGFIKATKAPLVDTYLYPPRPLIADFNMGSINMITMGTRDSLDTFCRANYDMAKGLIALLVVDAANMPVGGASISTSPAATKYCYNSMTPLGALPNENATATFTDGIAYAFNITPGTAMVSGMATGMTFHTTTLKTRANALTTTVIQP